MDQGVEALVPILFHVLVGFIILNIVINLVLLHIRRERINALLCMFWPAVLLVILTQSYFQEGDLAVTLAYSMTLLSTMLIAVIGFEVISEFFPIRWYSVLCIFSILLSVGLGLADFRFEVVAMPVAIATASGVTHFAYLVLVKERHRTTRLQKLLGVICTFIAVHCINFALFRMQPGTQLWGWVVTYAIYDAVAILLPAIVLENAYTTETTRLQKLIEERTAALDKSLEENKGLLKILLHDIYNPLSVIGMYIHTLQVDSPVTRNSLENLKRSHSALESILSNLRILDQREQSESRHTAIGLEECCKEGLVLFTSLLEQKQLSLEWKNELAEDVAVLVNRVLFIHSVFGNLLSNAIKFSPPGSMIKVRLCEERDTVTLELSDQGGGIPHQVVQQLEHNQKPKSTFGTAGEIGTGVGLSIVKSVVESFGGWLFFHCGETAADGHKGTIVRVTFKKLVSRSVTSSKDEPVVGGLPGTVRA